ncbi:MAG: hypothetical protein LBB63_00925 [Holosporaceae bacterium]|jgi:hypothetical protein|nr:hypothetical protein [Holosporaceae bacterium]
MNLENAERNRIYSEGVAKYNNRKAAAEQVQLPSVFDSLVDQVNGFFQEMMAG